MTDSNLKLALWSFIVADGVTKDMPREVPVISALTDVPSGWACLGRHQADGRLHWSQMVRAVLMPPRASGRGLVTMAQQLFRLNEQLSAGYHAGELHLEVLQAVDVQVDGRQPLDEYVATATDDFEEVEHVR